MVELAPVDNVTGTAVDVLPGLLRLHGLTADQVDVTDEAIGAIIGGYTREAGVWRLAAVLGEVCAKVVRRRSEGDTAAVEVTPAKLAGMLGAPRHPAAEVAGRTGRPGVAVGLCCTALGGGAVSVIEASRMAGSGALTLTGGLGEAMQESARAIEVNDGGGGGGFRAATTAEVDAALRQRELFGAAEYPVQRVNAADGDDVAAG